VSERKIAGRRFEWELFGAALSFVAAVLTGLLGILLTTSWIVIPALHPQLRGFGILFLIVALPLLICGGHCLDLLERRRKREREATFQTPERGSITVSCIVAAVILLGLAFIAPLEFCAQQTIFSVPTTDVLDRGKVYAELDFSFKPTDSSSVNQFSSFVPRVVVGTGGNVEVGLNVTGNIQPGADTTTLVPTAKWKLYDGKDNGWAFVIGNNLFIPVRNRSYRAGNYVYAEISKTFKSGTRITAAGYDFTKNIVSTANRAGGQFAFEQPLNSKVTFAADWYTGKHSSGYFTPGIIFKPAPKVTGYAGYSIGNQNPSRGNHFFLLEVGYNFN
jgi:hypothetical protein